MGLRMDELERVLKRYVSTGAAVVVVLLGSAQAGTPAPGPPASSGQATTAAAVHGWGAPTRVEEFGGGTEQWQLYDGPGHGDKGRRAPGAVAVRDGVLTITGDPSGTTGGMSWGEGRRHGRWEARVRAPVADPSYNAVMLLWSDKEDWPAGGEIDAVDAGAAGAG